MIEGVRELFAEEGLEEQVLKDLKQVCWVPLLLIDIVYFFSFEVMYVSVSLPSKTCKLLP